MEQDVTRERLNSHSAQLDELRDCVTRLTTLMESANLRSDDHEERIRAIESKGGQSWEKAVWLIAAGVLGAIIAFVLGSVGIR